MFHLSNCVKRFGSLVDYSTYAYESLYHHLLGDHTSSVTTNFACIAGERLVISSYSKFISKPRLTRWKELLPELERRANLSPAVSEFMSEFGNRREPADVCRLLNRSDLSSDHVAIVPSSSNVLYSRMRRQRLLLSGPYFNSKTNDSYLLYQCGNGTIGAGIIHSPG